ncbi:hypothetical protein ADIS_0209 [Lunatimonas lonarensis]|uniref:Uncharacterized protein n=1 Tax=Lunatimonas lonarensis TaxID=1232681 RepID=R7ZZ02_9BACT|nr:hypothetical protein ADIS_0209 [Lunatimonas lonarensis]
MKQFLSLFFGRLLPESVVRFSVWIGKLRTIFMIYGSVRDFQFTPTFPWNPLQARTGRAWMI